MYLNVDSSNDIINVCQCKEHNCLVLVYHFVPLFFSQMQGSIFKKTKVLSRASVARRGGGCLAKNDAVYSGTILSICWISVLSIVASLLAKYIFHQVTISSER